METLVQLALAAFTVKSIAIAILAAFVCYDLVSTWRRTHED